MTKHLLAGPSGTGKTTVGEVLKSRGFRVVDTDPIGRCVNLATGVQIPTEQLPPEPRSQEWTAAHGWFWDGGILRSVLSTCGIEPVFFCGGSFNETEFLDEFDGVFGLTTENNDVLAQRLIQREPERYSGDAPELEIQLAYNSRFPEHCRKYGYVMLDCVAPPEALADTILDHIQRGEIRAPLTA